MDDDDELDLDTPFLQRMRAQFREQFLQEGIQIGRVEGEQKQLLASIEIILDLKFGAAGQVLLPEIGQITALPLLETIRDSLRAATTLEEVRAVYQAHLPEPPADPQTDAGQFDTGTAG